MEAALSFTFWTMYPGKKDFGMNDFCRWPLESFEYHGLCNLVDQLDRPDIPKLRADTVFLDKKAYMIPHIYGSLIEDEYQKMVLDELKAERFDMKLMESSMASNPEDNPQGDYYLSTARAYFAEFDDAPQLYPIILDETHDHCVSVRRQESGQRRRRPLEQPRSGL
jgi:hypothetical protein